MAKKRNWPVSKAGQQVPTFRACWIPLCVPMLHGLGGERHGVSRKAPLGKWKHVATAKKQLLDAMILGRFSYLGSY